jgi:hypothetical protein
MKNRSDISLLRHRKDAEGKHKLNPDGIHGKDLPRRTDTGGKSVLVALVVSLTIVWLSMRISSAYSIGTETIPETDQVETKKYPASAPETTPAGANKKYPALVPEKK